MFDPINVTIRIPDFSATSAQQPEPRQPVLQANLIDWDQDQIVPATKKMPDPPKHPNEVTPLLRAQEPTYSAAGSSSMPQHVHHNQVIRNGDLGKDPHSQFCALTGCPPTNAPPGFKYRLNERTLYGRAQNEANTQNKMYWFTATLTNFLLLTQIVLGALLTGLGGSNVPGYVITVIGAVNTVIAGIVTYLKSRGQPMRARAFRDELNLVVDEIENSEVMWLGISKGAHGYTDLNTDTAVTVRSEVARLTCLLEEAIIRDSQNNPEQYSTGVPPQIGLGQFGGLRKYVNKDPETVSNGISSLESEAATARKSGKEPALALLPAKPTNGDDAKKTQDEDKKKDEESKKAESSNTSSETKTSDSKGKQTSSSSTNMTSTNTTTAFSSIGSFLPSITESKNEQKSESADSTSKKEQGKDDAGSGTGFSLTDK